jgi:hypothetical protein
VNIESNIARWVEVVQRKLDELLPDKPDDEAFRQAVHPLMAAFCEEIGSRAEVSGEYTIALGRADSIFNRVVIEYRRPGYLNLNFDKATDSAIERLLGYLHRLVEDEKSGIRRVAGVVFDGRCIIFAQCVNGEWREDFITEVNRDTLERLLVQLSGTAPGNPAFRGAARTP